jgi:8-oxo-dGTP pyrophosphatase MutT (NUDIX family)
MVFPSVWDVSAAGHVGAGEDVIESMKREAEEEIGLKTDNIEFIKTKRFDNITSEFSNKEIVHIHLIKCDWDIDKFVIQEEELDDLKWFDVDFIIKDLDEHPEKYTPNHDYWKEVLNKIKELV